MVYFSLVDPSAEEHLVWTASIPTSPNFNFTLMSRIEDPNFALFQIDPFSKDEREVVLKRGEAVLPNTSLRLLHLQTGCYATCSTSNVAQELNLNINSSAPIGLSVFTRRPRIENGVFEKDEVAILANPEDSRFALARDNWFKGTSPDRFLIHRFEALSVGEDSAIRLGRVCKFRADNGMFLSVLPNTEVDFKLVLDIEEMKEDYKDGGEFCYPEYQGSLRADLSNSEEDGNTCWVIEGADRFKGGTLHSETAFNLRHLASRRYLRADLSLTNVPSPFTLSSEVKGELAYGQLSSLVTESDEAVSIDLAPSMSSVKTEVFGAVLSDLDPDTVLRLPLSTNPTHAQAQSLKFLVLQVDREQANKALELALYLPRLSEMRLALQHLKKQPNVPKVLYGISNRISLNTLAVSSSEHTFQAQIASDFQIVNEMLRIWILMKLMYNDYKEYFDDVNFFKYLRNPMQNIQFYERVSKNLFANRKFLLSLADTYPSQLADILQWSLKSHLPKDEDRQFWAQKYFFIMPKLKNYDDLSEVLYFCHYLLDRLSTKIYLSDDSFVKVNDAYILRFENEDSVLYEWTHAEKHLFQKAMDSKLSFTATCLEFLADLCANTGLKDDIVAGTGLSVQMSVTLCRAAASRLRQQMAFVYFISKVHVPGCCGMTPLTQLTGERLLEQAHLSQQSEGHADWFFFPDASSPLGGMLKDEITFWFSTTHVPIKFNDPTTWYYNTVVHFQFIASLIEHCPVSDAFVASMVSAAVAFTWTALGEDIPMFSERFPKLKESKFRTETEMQRTVEELLELLLVYQKWKLVKVLRNCVEWGATRESVQSYISSLNFNSILNSMKQRSLSEESTVFETERVAVLPDSTISFSQLLNSDKVHVKAILEHIAYKTIYTCRGSHQIVLSLLESEYDFAEFAFHHMRKLVALEPFIEFLQPIRKIQSLALSYNQLATSDAAAVEKLGNYNEALEELVDFMLQLQQDEASFIEYQQFLDKADFIKELKRAWSYCVQIPEKLSEDPLIVSLRTATIEASRLYVYNFEEHKKQLLRILPIEGFYLDYPQYIQLLVETRLLESGGDVASNISQLIFEMSLRSNKKRLLLAIKALLSNSNLLSRTIFTMIKHYNTVQKEALDNCEWELLILASLSLLPNDRKEWLSKVVKSWYNLSSSNIRREGAAITIFSTEPSNAFFTNALNSTVKHLRQINERSMEVIKSNIELLEDIPKIRRNRNYENMDSDIRYCFELYFEEKMGVVECLPSWQSAKDAPSLVLEFAKLYLKIVNLPALEKFSRTLYTRLNEYFGVVAAGTLDEEVRSILEKVKATPYPEATLSKSHVVVPKLSAIFNVPDKNAGPSPLVAAVLFRKNSIDPEYFAELKTVFLQKKAEGVYMEASLEAASRLKFEEIDKKERDFMPMVEELLELAISHSTEKMQELALQVLNVIVAKNLNIRPFLIKTLQHRQLYIRFFSVFAAFIERRKKLLRVISAETGSILSALNGRLSTVNNVLQRFLELFQKCCDGCYLPFQDYLRVQGQDSRSRVNVVSLATVLLVELLLSALSSCSERLIRSCASALLEMVSGPCRENQEEVCRTFGFVPEVAKAVEKAATTGLSSDLGIESSLVSLVLGLIEGQERAYESIENMMPMDFSVFGKLSTKVSYSLSDAALKNMDLGLQTSPLEKAQFELATGCLIICFSTMRRDQLGIFQSQRLIKYIASVEISNPSNKIPVSTITFRIPFNAQFLTRQTALRVLSEIDRESRLVKLEDFSTKVDQCEVEMKHQQRLSRSAVLKFVTQYWRQYLLSSFVLIVTLNLMLIGLVHKETDSRFSIEESGRTAMVVIGAVQTMLIFCGTLSYYLEYWYSLQLPIKRRTTTSAIEDLPYIKNLGVAASRFFEVQIISTLHLDFFEVAKALGQVAYAGVSLAAIVLPYLYPVLLFQILNLNSSVVNILKSVTNRATQLLLALFFALIVIFAHSFYAYFYLYDYYDNESGMFCDNLHKCFFSTITLGLRSGGGIGDALGPTRETDFYARMAFDLLFYVTITTVLMAIVFGLIIDTFSELRDEKNDREADMNNICLICGHKRTVIEMKGEGWQKHTLQVHNPFSYMYFLLYVKNKSLLECSGVEKMVKECKALKNVSFYPTTSAAIGITDEADKE